MYEKVWFERFGVLYEKNRITEFWPTKYQTKAERINSVSRFVIYFGLIISMYRKSYDPFMLSVIILLSMFLMMNSRTIPRYNKNVRHYNPNGTMMYDQDCQIPTTQNPFGNVLLGDSVNRRQACPIDEVSNVISEKFNSTVYKSPFDIFDNQNSQRQFYSTPNTMTPNDQTGFATWLYGNQKICKNEPKACT